MGLFFHKVAYRRHDVPWFVEYMDFNKIGHSVYIVELNAAPLMYNSWSKVWIYKFSKS
jgi:hypothetical protein